MAKYHINPKTGRPNQCTATVRGCAYAKDGEIPEHYESKEEARKAYEKDNKSNALNSISKNTKNDSGKLSKDDGDEGFLKVSKVVTSHYNLGDGARVSLPSDWDVSQLSSQKFKLNANIVADDLTTTDYSTALRDIDGWQRSDVNGVKFNEGKYTHPTPNDPYHEDDRHYLENPSFTVVNEEKFTENVLQHINSKNKGFSVHATPELISDLKSEDFYNGDRYKAKMEYGYYGEDFRCFYADEDMAFKWGKIIAFHKLAQEKNSDKLEY